MTSLLSHETLATPSTVKPWIAHLDLDCFFVSVERIKDPSLIGKPVIVGGSPTGRGVVASASYEARKFGVRSAMPTGQALKLCPHLTIVGGSHGEYSEYSNRLYQRMLEIAPVVERASIDEMYLDFSGCESLYSGDLPGFMHSIQKLISDEFQLPCTIALASNTLVAKIAANRVKPNGVTFILHGTEAEYLAPMPIGVIPGVGNKTEEYLKRNGIELVKDLQAMSLVAVKKLLGEHGDWLYRAAHGRGRTSLTTEHERKSISREETFFRDISLTAELTNILFALTESVCSSLRRKHLKARTITLKLRTSKFETFTRRTTLQQPSCYDPIIFQAAQSLLKAAHDNCTPMRLLGIGVSGFVNESDQPLELFPVDDRTDKMLSAVDAIRKKFGEDVIKIGQV